MTEMVERVARALWDADDPDTRTLDADPKYREQARAAIEALMPPSPAMLDAALEMSGARVTPYTAHRESGVATECDISPEDAAWMNDEVNKEHDNLFRAMLGAALNIQDRTT